ncbi:MAG: ice-binding family protein [Fibrobacteria bacterium]
MKTSPLRPAASAAAMASLLLLSLNLFLGESHGAGIARISVGPDSTAPGAGTGFAGAGKGPSPVALGKAGDFAILAKTAVTATGTFAVTGDVGISPAAGSSITGFDLLAPPTTYATANLVTGKVYAADYDPPTPQNLTTAILDMMTAYTDAAGRAPDYTELGAGDIGGKTLSPAVYKWGSDLLIQADLTLSGGPNDVWIFQIAGNLVQASGVAIVLKGGALSKHIFWQVAGSADHATTSHFEGVEVCQTGIVYKTGATANGRMLAQTAVVLDANTIMAPNDENTGLRETAAAAAVAQGMRVMEKGGHLILEMKAVPVARSVSIYDVEGVLRHRLSLAAGQTRASLPMKWAPRNGYRFLLN